jgi:hypothetical protein
LCSSDAHNLLCTIPPQPASTTPNVGAAATVRVTATPNALGGGAVALPELEGVTAEDAPFTVASWNINMNEADQPSIAAQIAAFEVSTVGAARGGRLEERRALSASAGKANRARLPLCKGRPAAIFR